MPESVQVFIYKSEEMEHGGYLYPSPICRLCSFHFALRHSEVDRAKQAVQLAVQRTLAPFSKALELKSLRIFLLTIKFGDRKLNVSETQFNVEKPF